MQNGVDCRETNLPIPLIASQHTLPRVTRSSQSNSRRRRCVSLVRQKMPVRSEIDSSAGFSSSDKETQVSMLQIPVDVRSRCCKLTRLTEVVGIRGHRGPCPAPELASASDGTGLAMRRWDSSCRQTQGSPAIQTRQTQDFSLPASSHQYAQEVDCACVDMLRVVVAQICRTPM